MARGKKSRGQIGWPLPYIVYMAQILGITIKHELKSYESNMVELVDETMWQYMMAGDLNFGAEVYYLEVMQMLDSL